MKSLRDHKNEIIEQTRAKAAVYKLIEPFHEQITKGLASVIVIHEYIDTQEFNLSIAGDRETLKTCFRVLRALGFKPNDRPDDKPQPTFCTRFRHPSNACIWFSFSSTVCRRVQVGTKTIETPIYETRCEPEADAVEQILNESTLTQEPQLTHADIPF